MILCHTLTNIRWRWPSWNCLTGLQLREWRDDTQGADGGIDEGRRTDVFFEYHVNNFGL